jgi:RND family efflux transporter MFP subunit
VFNGEEASLGRLRPGLAVSLTVAAFGEKAFKAAVTSIAPVADSTSRTFRIKAIPAAGQDGLRAGMFANIVVTTESRDGVLLIPQEALVQRGQDTIVFVIKSNVAEQRKIEVGLRNDRSVQVRSGLEEGEEVVVQGNRTLRQQDSVTVVK